MFGYVAYSIDIQIWCEKEGERRTPQTNYVNWAINRLFGDSIVLGWHH